MPVVAPVSDSPAPDDRRPARVLNYGAGPPEDGLERRSDVCPGCGGERWEMVVIPDRFFCDKCEVATVGPNTEAPEAQPEQMGFDLPDVELWEQDVLNLGADGPPPDEGMAWIADEMPDE